MAAEEDKKFDAVLGGYLINNARVRAEHLHCPEADVLAAYHERSLVPEEMNSWKDHIVGCARCQAILSEVEATDSIPFRAAEKEEAIRGGAATRVPDAGPAGKPSPIPFSKKGRVTRISRGVRWQWLAPAGAIAAGLLVWVAWHKDQTRQFKAPAEAKVARVESPDASATRPSATRQAPASPAVEEAFSVTKDQASTGGTVPATKSLPTENLKQFEKFDSRARTAPAKRLADKAAGAHEETRRDSALAANRVQNQPAGDAKTGVAGVAAEAVEVQTEAASAQLQTQLNQQNQMNQLNAQNVGGGPTPASQGQGAAKKAKSETRGLAYSAAVVPPAPPPKPSAQPAPNAPAAFSDVSASARLVGGPFLNLIATPNKKVLWRVGSAGRIEFSNDGGASWLRQNGNVLVDLTAGASPSDRVCWIVGRAGTILLTADTGSHWAIVHSPLDEDLGGVRATDALHATIWNLGNTKVFETSDGGATWRPPALP